MSTFEHILVVALLAVVVILYLYQKRSEIKYNEIVLLRDTAIDISNHMMDMETTDEGFQYILEKCIELIPDASLGSILMLDEDRFLTAHAHMGFSENEIKDFKIPFKESFVHHATGGELNEVIIINNLMALLKPGDTVETTNKGKYIQSQLTAPLMDGEKLIGVVCIDSLKNNVFSENDRVLLDYMMNHINGITKQQYLRERVIYHSRHDYLTKLYNRSYFDQMIEQQLTMLNRAIVLCVMDLDGLKVVNDVHGHLAGDQLIKVFSRELRGVLKPDEFAGRYGGDEFMVCFMEESIESAAERLKALERILEENAFEYNGEMLYPRFSYGFVMFPEEGVLLDVLLSKSDSRMYEQKKSK